MEKRNIVEQRRTPADELQRPDDHWDKLAVDMFSCTRTDRITQVGAKSKVRGHEVSRGYVKRDGSYD